MNGVDLRSRIEAVAMKASAAVIGLLALGSAVHAQEVAQGIRWVADRPLVWSDFRGAVAPDAEPSAAALTAASVSLGYALEVRRGRGCEYEITAIETSAEFHPEQSWVRDGARIDSVLEHEQGHFDLTEVFRAVLEQEANVLVGRTQRCATADMSAIEAEVGERVASIRERIFAELEQVQSQYDAETGHGTLPDQQRAWTSRIRAALRRGAW